MAVEVKIFAGNSTEELEAAVNQFLSNMSEDQHVVDIKHSVSLAGDANIGLSTVVTAMIIYRSSKTAKTMFGFGSIST